jgi:hypothetical protein
MVPLVTLATRSWPGRSSLPWSRAACLPVRVATARDVRYSSLCCRRSAAVHGRLPEWPKGTVCKTVGSAYVGSNPTPATTCENAPLAANSRASGAVLLCPVLCHLVASRAALSRCPRTYSGRDLRPGTVGAHRRLFHGRPRTGRASGWTWVAELGDRSARAIASAGARLAMPGNQPARITRSAPSARSPTRPVRPSRRLWRARCQSVRQLREAPPAGRATPG